MRILVLGGTKFLGRAIVEAALARGHAVTLFNRGETNPELFPTAEKLRGDRDGDLSALEGRSWDAVVDTSGYVPRVVRASAELLRDAVEFYVFISTRSVYEIPFTPGADETAPLIELENASNEDIYADPRNYGGLKALCEHVVEEVLPGRCAHVRAGLIVGPHDPTGRFTYWPHRIARGGDVLVPAPPDRRVQFIDVRDLGEWSVKLCESRRPGPYNAVNEGVAWGDLVETCRAATGADARFVWVSDEFLAEHEVGEWMELPLWIHDPEWSGLHQADVSRALAAGLAVRPLEETVRATLEEAEPTADAGLSPQREAALLAAWQVRA